MNIFNINDKHWFHNGHHVQIAGNMVCSYKFMAIRKFILENKITTLDINGQNHSFDTPWMMRAPFPWPESLDMSTATNLLEFLKDTPILVLNLAENCQETFPESPEMKRDKLAQFVDALTKTQIHTLNLTGCSFFESFECSFNPEDSTDGHFEYDIEIILYFAAKLKGSSITHIIGIEHSELTEILQQNMAGKKNRMIALGQGACNDKLNQDVLEHIVSYTSESKSSGKADEDYVDGYGSWASETAKAAFSLSDFHKENRFYWEQTGSILSGETTYLSDDMRVLKRAIEQTRYTFFNTHSPLNLKRDKAEAQQTQEPLLIAWYS